MKIYEITEINNTNTAKGAAVLARIDMALDGSGLKRQGFELVKDTNSFTRGSITREAETAIRNSLAKAKAMLGGIEPEDPKPIMTKAELARQEFGEAHGNSKVYDKCWDGYKKVPGKKRGEKGSCVKESVVILEEQFNRIEEMVNIIAEAHDVDPEVVWEDFESLSDDELYTIYEDWQKVNKKDKTDGMSRKAVKAYRRENPGSKLKTAVTTKPSKLKRGSKASKRRKSFCARSNGQKKMHNIDCSKTPDKAICKARRRWNC